MSLPRGFSRDHFVLERFRQLMHKHEIRTAIETGTYKGYTTHELCGIASQVYTVEVNPTHYAEAFANLCAGSNPFLAAAFLGDSPVVLRDQIHPLLKRAGTDRVIYYLDAHWGKPPLLDELAAIAHNGPAHPVIVIHDFKVPHEPELGFDTYNGQPFEWRWIASGIDCIYGIDRYSVSYNTFAKSAGARRGVIFIEPNPRRLCADAI